MSVMGGSRSAKGTLTNTICKVCSSTTYAGLVTRVPTASRGNTSRLAVRGARRIICLGRVSIPAKCRVSAGSCGIALTVKGAAAGGTASGQAGTGLGVTGRSTRANGRTRKSTALRNTMCNLCTERSVIRPSKEAKAVRGGSDLVASLAASGGNRTSMSSLCLKGCCLGRLDTPIKCMLSPARRSISYACRNTAIPAMREASMYGRAIVGRPFRVVGTTGGKGASTSLLRKINFST